jgi:hypothetical protein
VLAQPAAVPGTRGEWRTATIPSILEELAQFGVFPTSGDPPAWFTSSSATCTASNCGGCGNGWYGEIRRRLREPRSSELRRRYPLVSIRAALWAEHD